MASKTMSTATLAASTGASLRQLDHWTTKGYIKEAGEPAGKGQTREYSAAAVKQVRSMLALINIGFPPKRAGELARQARFQGANTYFVDSDGFRIEWIQA